MDYRYILIFTLLFSSAFARVRILNKIKDNKVRLEYIYKTLEPNNRNVCGIKPKE